MADNTDIEWTDATWNPITGCSIVSPGCTNCYAMALAGTRLKNHESRKGLTKQVNGKHVWTGEVRFNAQWLDQPLRWSKPRMIFVCAHGDLFAEGVPDEWLDQIFAVMALCPQHTFQVLTKRPERMREYVKTLPARSGAVGKWAAWHWGAQDPDLLYDQVAYAVFSSLPNVWLGVSVEDQRRADERIPILLDTPAAIRWVSAEPLLGELRLSGASEDRKRTWDWLTGMNGIMHPDGPDFDYGSKLDWVVAGGESGPMHPDWARALRDQCASAGVPFMFKQWGEWVPRRAAEHADLVDARKSLIVRPDGGITSGLLAYGPDAWLMDNVGKRRAGRLLDDVEHNAFPQPIRTAPIQAERPSRDVPRPVRSAGEADSVRTR